MTNLARKTALAVRISAQSHLTHVMNPGSEVGPEPVEIPATGYSLIAEMLCHGNAELQISGFSVAVIQRAPFRSDSVMVALPPSRNPVVLSPDVEEAVRELMADFKPLAIPHHEILLDREPPLLRRALKADGLPARPAPEFPFTLHPNEHLTFFLAPITQDPRLTVFSLSVIWEFEGGRNEAPYGTFLTTGSTNFRRFSPDGKVVHSPVTDVAPDHWDIR